MNWRQHILGLSAHAGSSGAFWKSCTLALDANGVAGFGYGIVPFSVEAELQGYSEAGFFRHTYPREWVDAVGPDTAFDNDASVDMIVDGTSEIIWGDLDTNEEISNEQRIQNEIDNDVGMRFGASLNLGRNALGQAVSGVGLWVNDVRTNEAFALYWREHEERLRQICHILDEGLKGHHADVMVSLTSRERDCLTYLAVGLRPVEICWKLSISERTFEKYIKGAKDKLRAKTRDHAIAKALVLNLIQP